jgi:hypothetical protein
LVVIRIFVRRWDTNQRLAEFGGAAGGVRSVRCERADEPVQHCGRHLPGGDSAGEL